MARQSRSRELGVWTNGMLVGHWQVPSRGAMAFTYEASWVEAKEARPLSLSIPINLDRLTVTGPQVANYFDNLLPDIEPMRRRIQARFGTPTRDPFDLLAAIGRDCVGAIQLLPIGEEPGDVFSIRVSALSEARVESILQGVERPSNLSKDDDELRISLAGAQEKTALTRHRGRWCVPHGSTPTTHIFKLPLGLVGSHAFDLTTSVENEWLCSRILSAFGLPIAKCQMAQFGAMKTLIVARFDRKLHESGAYWLRLPQEDFCQATATPSSHKYEAEGGPGLVQISRILQASDTRDSDLAILLHAQLLFWMLGATDGHAKNFSIHLFAGGGFRLTPLYDVISAWPIVGPKQNQLHQKKLKLAMALHGKNRHYRLAEIRRHHFDATARLCGLGPDMSAIIEATIDATPKVIDRVEKELPSGFPARIFETITHGLLRASQTLKRAA
ncbi:MAG TPA: type II toxin-antitoxin system HipA family toxin [Polyangiaceae bacterium]|nr:type II toxin-antitoxin system HipA family toxin [Polyangiaceae bacterium]